MVRRSPRDMLTRAVDANLPSYVSLLQHLVQTPSPNPPGNTIAAINVIARFLSDEFLGIETRIESPCIEKPNLLASFTGGAGPGPRVILNGHIDTYPSKAKGDENDWDPYSGWDDGVAIHGRGGVDMKAGTAALAIAFGLLYERRADLRGSVGLMCVSDEESGGRWGSEWLLKHDPGGVVGDGEAAISPWQGDVMLNAEPGGLRSVRFGEKGTLRMTFVVKTAGQNGAYTFHSEGAIRVGTRLIGELLVLETLRPHLDDDLRRYLESDEVKRVADEIMGDGAGDNLLVPTVNIGTIQGGLKVNMVPEECVFEADIRLPIGMAASKILESVNLILQSFPQANVIVQEAASDPANFCEKDHSMARLLMANALEVTGERPVMLSGLGATDCRFWRYRDIPAYVFGPSPQGMGSTGEAVKKAEFEQVLKVHALSVWDFLAREEL